MSETTILPSVFLPIAVGLATAGYGAYWETHYVSKVTIIVNIVNILVTWAFTPVESVPFVVITAFLGFGLFAISRDLHHHPQRKSVAFFLGSKTQGGVTVFNGFIVNNWIMSTFTPVLEFVENTQEIPQTELTIYTHIIGFVIIVGFIHIAGQIIEYIKNH